MPDPYASTRARRMAEVLARVEAGWALDAIWRDPGQPCRETVRRWRRTNAAFAAEFKKALAKGRWRRKWMFDQALADALLARYRAGERLTAILKDPAMPSRGVYNYWRGTQAPFCAEVERLKAARQARQAAALCTPRRLAFDPAVADRIVAGVLRGAWLAEVLAADPTLPSSYVLHRWRREQPPFDRTLRQAMIAVRGRHTLARRHRAAIEDRVAALIEAGATLAAVAARRDMPNRDTLHRWLREDPAFAARIQAARDARRHRRERPLRRARIMRAARRRMAEVGRKGRRPEGG